MVAFSDDSMINTLPQNSFYSVLNAIRGMSNEYSASKVYGPMPEPEMHAIVRKSGGLEGPTLDPTFPSLHIQHASASLAQPLNLVIIVAESLCAQYIGTPGGQGLSPQFDALEARLVADPRLCHWHPLGARAGGGHHPGSCRHRPRRY